jgi:hypothetical protein
MMKDALPVIGAGATFAGTVLAGLLAGIWLAGRTGAQGWVLGGLFGGLALGGYAAVRLVMRSK